MTCRNAATEWFSYILKSRHGCISTMPFNLWKTSKIVSLLDELWPVQKLHQLQRGHWNQSHEGRFIEGGVVEKLAELLKSEDGLERDRQWDGLGKGMVNLSLYQSTYLSKRFPVLQLGYCRCLSEEFLPDIVSEYNFDTIEWECSGVTVSEVWYFMFHEFHGLFFWFQGFIFKM